MSRTGFKQPEVYSTDHDTVKAMAKLLGINITDMYSLMISFVETRLHDLKSMKDAFEKKVNNKCQ